MVIISSINENPCSKPRADVLCIDLLGGRNILITVTSPIRGLAYFGWVSNARDDRLAARIGTLVVKIAFISRLVAARQVQVDIQGVSGALSETRFLIQKANAKAQAELSAHQYFMENFHTGLRGVGRRSLGTGHVPDPRV